MTFKRFSLGLRFLLRDAEGFSPAEAWELLFACLSAAEVKGMEPEEAARITLENGKRFFNIKEA